MKLHFVMLSVLLGGLGGWFLVSHANSSSALSAGGAISIDTTATIAPNANSTDGVVKFGSAAIGPKKGDKGTALQPTISSIDQIVGGSEIKIKN